MEIFEFGDLTIEEKKDRVYALKNLLESDIEFLFVKSFVYPTKLVTV